ncbi:hypothetical protein GCM10009682_05920 [Luedemannella flava]|uniref:DUF3618 domain-containing protein n=1 Tax=Luedemannella flava TaxID=349316 RepID=A0ABN2LH66_9ACTN
MTEAPEPAELRADIAQHRAELADTVEQLAARTNLKARARKSAAAAKDQAKEALTTAVDETKDAVSTAVDEVKQAGRAAADQFSGSPAAVVRRPVPWALVGFVVAGAVVGWLVWRRRT